MAEVYVVSTSDGKNSDICALLVPEMSPGLVPAMETMDLWVGLRTACIRTLKFMSSCWLDKTFILVSIWSRAPSLDVETL